MTRSALALLLALAGIGPAAQETAGPAAVPQRYRPIAKTAHTRLLQVYGGPEVPSGFSSTGAYAASGKLAVFAGNMPVVGEKAERRCVLFVWDLQRQVFVKEIPLAGREVTAIAVSADGGRALLGLTADDPKTLQAASALLWLDLTTGKELGTFGPHPQYIQAVALSPDGTHGLAGTLGGLHCWDLARRQPVGKFAVPAQTLVASVAFLPDGKRALSGWGGGVRLWDLATAKAIRTYTGDPTAGTTLALAVAADGKRFATADLGVGAALWETETGRELASWRPDGMPPVAYTAQAALSADGQSVYVAYGILGNGAGVRESTLLCRFDAGRAQPAWRQATPLTGSVPLRLDGSRLLVGGGANPFAERDPADGRERRAWGGAKGPINALARLPSGELLAAGSEGLIFRCTADGRLATAWRAHDAAINALAVSPDGKQLLTAATDKTVRLHDVGRQAPVRTLTGHTGPVAAVVFGADGHWAASAGDDRTIILWDLATGKPRQRLEGHSARVNALALAPAGDWLASASDDNTVQLWPLKDGQPDPDRDPVVLGGHTRQVLCVAFAPDGKRLVSAGQDQTIKVWDVAREKEVGTLKGHTNWVTAVVFQGADVVVSASDDLTVRLWDAAAGKELDRVDLSEVADGPRCLAVLGADEFAVGTTGWVVLRFARVK